MPDLWSFYEPAWPLLAGSCEGSQVENVLVDRCLGASSKKTDIPYLVGTYIRRSNWSILGNWAVLLYETEG